MKSGEGQVARKLAASFSPFSRKSLRMSHSDVSCHVSCQLIEHVFVFYKMFIFKAEWRMRYIRVFHYLQVFKGK